MLLGSLEFNEDKVPDHFIPDLVEDLVTILASALSCEPAESGRLAPGDVRVNVTQFGRDDRHTHDLELTVWASFLPEREQDLDVRREQVVEGIKQYFARYHPGHTRTVFSVGVSVFLVPGSHCGFSVQVGP